MLKPSVEPETRTISALITLRVERKIPLSELEKHMGSVMLAAAKATSAQEKLSATDLYWQAVENIALEPFFNENVVQIDELTVHEGGEFIATRRQ